MRWITIQSKEAEGTLDEANKNLQEAEKNVEDALKEEGVEAEKSVEDALKEKGIGDGVDQIMVLVMAKRRTN